AFHLAIADFRLQISDRRTSTQSIYEIKTNLDPQSEIYQLFTAMPYIDPPATRDAFFVTFTLNVYAVFSSPGTTWTTPLHAVPFSSVKVHQLCKVFLACSMFVRVHLAIGGPYVLLAAIDLLICSRNSLPVDSVLTAQVFSQLSTEPARLNGRHPPSRTFTS